jgi:hypothetical protein
MLSHLAVAGLAFVAGLAPRPVTYDPETKEGFVDAAEIRDKFGWSEATLAARAGSIAFTHDFYTDDTYTVSCGKESFPVVFHHDYGYLALTRTIARETSGYHPKLLGFRITGANAGVSGTTVPPLAGEPCPEKGRGGEKITRSHLDKSVETWALTASSGTASRRLMVVRVTRPAGHMG